MKQRTKIQLVMFLTVLACIAAATTVAKELIVLPSAIALTALTAIIALCDKKDAQDHERLEKALRSGNDTYLDDLVSATLKQMHDKAFIAKLVKNLFATTLHAVALIWVVFDFAKLFLPNQLLAVAAAATAFTIVGLAVNSLLVQVYCNFPPWKEQMERTKIESMRSRATGAVLTMKKSPLLAIISAFYFFGVILIETLLINYFLAICNIEFPIEHLMFALAIATISIQSITAHYKTLTWFLEIKDSTKLELGGMMIKISRIKGKIPKDTLNELVSIHKTCFPDDARNPEDRKGIFKAWNNPPIMRYWVAKKAGNVVSYIRWVEHGGVRPEAVIELEQIAVHPHYQRHGIAKQLIKTSIEEIQHDLQLDERTIKLVYVMTGNDNYAQELYRETLGAEIAAEIPSFYEDDKTNENEVVMISRSPLSEMNAG